MLFENLLDFPTPCHVIDCDKIESNLTILNSLRSKTNLTLLFAIKGFSNDKILKHFAYHFDGISASSLWEARLGKEMLSLPVHIFSPSYNEKNFSPICTYSDVIIFNSIGQWKRFGKEISSLNIDCGIRINPEYSEVEKFAINPCHNASRFGVLSSNLNEIDFSKVSGLHFHSMCEQLSSTFLNTMKAVEMKFNDYFEIVKWLNIGGGQLFCNEFYQLTDAVNEINRIQNKYNLQIIAEPCEGILENAGYFIATVTDIVFNKMFTAILDASAICHLPDIVNSPYRCEIRNAAPSGVKPYTYRISGSTCYAGDIFGDYSFDNPLEIGSKIIFCDTASYSMVKSNIFNGIPLPTYISVKGNSFTVEKSYDYNTFLSFI